MRKHIQRFLNRLLLAAVAFVAATPSGYAYDVEIDGICYDLDQENKTASVTKVNKDYTGNASIPSSFISEDITYSVTSIGSYAFYSCSSLTSVDIPNSVTSIGTWAFYGCTSLTSVTIPNSVTIIGSGAFSGCTGLTSVAIPNSVTSIGSGAFNGCTGLTSVAIPNSVTSIGDNAFPGCTSLTAIHVDADNPAYSSVDGVLYDKSRTTLKAYPNGKESIFTIPDFVTSIGNAAFEYCTGLTSVTIPNSVTSIGDFAFCGCTGLTSMTIPNSVTNIGGDAFRDCTNLTSVTISKSVTSIGERTFSGCTSLTAIHVDADNPAYSSVDGILYDKSRTTLKAYPNGKGSIFTIPDFVTSIGYGAFFGCTGLTSVDIPNSVTSIEDYAFALCTSLTSVTIPSSVTSFGVWAFYWCRSLTTIYCFNPVPPSDVLHFFEYDCYQNATLYVPNEAVEAYKAADVWQNFQNIQGFDATGIEAIEADGNSKQEVYYDLNGRRLNAPAKGFNIVRYSDGTTRKVIVK